MSQSISTTALAPQAPPARVLDYAVPAVILLAVLVVLAPVPPALVDLLLAANLTVSILALLGALAARTPLDMGVFPTFLLGSTLVRLVLNIATTRLILSRAALDGADAAGEVVQAFGAFVSANNLVVGAVIFAIIAVVQFVVITAGSTRTSEVAARFALDGLPGRQMAIDAEANAGTITRDQARALRLDLQRQADFFASMDGASRFVKGEAVASVIITLVNLVGGLVIGVVQHGMPVQKAVEIYSRLTIGDGLVSAVPALFVSVATGLLISRSSQAINLSQELGRQFTSRPHVLAITGVFLAVLSLTGLPFLPLAAMAAVSFAAALLTGRRRQRADAMSTSSATAARVPDAQTALTDVLADERVVMHLGRGLLDLVQGAAPLVARSQAVRSAVAADLGLVVPSIAFRDDLSLPPRGYRITIAGERTREADLPPDDGREQSVATLAAALTTAVHERADTLLTRDACARLVETLRESQPAVVGQIVPEVLSLAKIHRTLQGLLREGMPIRPLAELLELMADHAAEATDPADLADVVRGRLVHVLCRRLRDPDGRLVVLKLTDSAVAALHSSAADISDRASPAAKVVAEIRRAARPRLDRGAAAVIVAPAESRREVRDRLARLIPGIVVMGSAEVAGEPRVEVFATIGGTEASRAA
ncbi:MAG: FHIPEP family type III secretion protein [Planctomycetia bacterium]